MLCDIAFQLLSILLRPIHCLVNYVNAIVLDWTMIWTMT